MLPPHTTVQTFYRHYNTHLYIKIIVIIERYGARSDVQTAKAKSTSNQIRHGDSDGHDLEVTKETLTTNR